MFACLYLPPPANSLPVKAEGSGQRAAVVPANRAYDVTHAALVQLARDFSPRVETPGARTVMLDISGLGNLIGEPRAIGEELRRAAADAGLRVHIAVAATSTAAMLIAHARAGLTVVAQGDETKALAPLPLRTLTLLGFGLPASGSGPGPRPEARSLESEVDQLARWGLKTLGDLASLPANALSARLGQHGLRWQKWARGEEIRPLVPAGVADEFEESLDLEWPIEGLEPLSFVLARLLDPLCDRLERGDRGAVALRVTLTLVTRDRHERVVELPAPMRDARVLRTLALMDLESNPPSEGIDRVTVRVDVTEGRVLQFGLFARALPTDTLATLMARLGALMGSDRIGAPALVDTYRPGAFTMAKFDPPRDFKNHQSLSNPQSLISHPKQGTSVLRRFRSPIPARVTLEHGRPVRVTTDRRGVSGGRVERSEGPWRSSGDWWKTGWNCDEWDVAFHDGTSYRISHAHDQGTWSVDGLLD